MKEEIEAAKAVLDSSNWTMGEKCAQFEEDFAKYIGSKHAIFVNSGSTANLLMMAVLQHYRYHGEVIVPALTWSTGIWPVTQTGFLPVLVDCDEHLQIDTDKIEKAITGKTRAIFVAHIMGNACDMNRIQEIAEKHDLIILEDACEALGVDYRDKKVGTFGWMGSYSFYYSHHITTIEGGMVVTDDDVVADILRSMRAHGWTRHMHDRSIEADYPEIDPKFMFVHTGYSVRPTEIQGAFGIHQLRKLDWYNEQRRRNHRDMREALSGYPMEFIEPTEGANPAWFGFVFLVDNRDELVEFLDVNNINNRPVIAGNMARHPAMKNMNFKGKVNKKADDIMQRGIYIDVFEPDIGHLVAALDYFYDEKKCALS